MSKERKQQLVMCPRCKGDGHWHSTVGWAAERNFIKCPMCQGVGRVAAKTLRSITEVPMFCIACLWAGFVGDCEPGDDGELLCPSCNKPVKESKDVTISGQHAHSLTTLVKWFKKMIEQGNMPEQEGRSDELTAAYCDELLEDLGSE